MARHCAARPLCRTLPLAGSEYMPYARRGWQKLLWGEAYESFMQFRREDRLIGRGEPTLSVGGDLSRHPDVGNFAGFCCRCYRWHHYEVRPFGVHEGHLVRSEEDRARIERGSLLRQRGEERQFS